MLNNWKKRILLTVMFLFCTYSQVYAQLTIPNPSVCEDMGCFLERVGNLIRPVAAVSFLLMFTYGAFLYMTAADNDDQLKQARGVMTGAVIGIVLVFTAPALTNFVLSLFRTTFIR